MELAKIIRECAGTKSAWQVWEDFVCISAIAISNQLDYRQEREDEYLQRITGYDEVGRYRFSEMLYTLYMEFETKEFGDAPRFGDVLGETYMQLELYNKWKGQFFTPYSVSVLMAKLRFEEQKNDDTDLIKVYDPTCGGGALLIASAQVLHEQSIDFRKRAVFVGQDLDRITALMCYVQMSALGMTGYVIVGDTLKNELETYEKWYTPAYILNRRKQKCFREKK